MVLQRKKGGTSIKALRLTSDGGSCDSSSSANPGNQPRSWQWLSLGASASTASSSLLRFLKSSDVRCLVCEAEAPSGSCNTANGEY